MTPELTKQIDKLLAADKRLAAARRAHALRLKHFRLYVHDPGARGHSDIVDALQREVDELAASIARGLP